VLDFDDELSKDDRPRRVGALRVLSVPSHILDLLTAKGRFKPLLLTNAHQSSESVASEAMAAKTFRAGIVNKRATKILVSMAASTDLMLAIY
jgi:hypothetical protein